MLAGFSSLVKIVMNSPFTISETKVPPRSIAWSVNNAYAISMLLNIASKGRFADGGYDPPLFQIEIVFGLT